MLRNVATEQGGCLWAPRHESSVSEQELKSYLRRQGSCVNVPRSVWTESLNTNGSLSNTSKPFEPARPRPPPQVSPPTISGYIIRESKFRVSPPAKLAGSSIVFVRPARGSFRLSEQRVASRMGPRRTNAGPPCCGLRSTASRTRQGRQGPQPGTEHEVVPAPECLSSFLRLESCVGSHQSDSPSRGAGDADRAPLGPDVLGEIPWRVERHVIPTVFAC